MLRMLVLSLALALSISQAGAQYASIGCYDDPDFTICYGDIELYITKTVHVAVWLSAEFDNQKSFEFRIDNLPESNANGFRTDHWGDGDAIVIGDPSVGLYIHFAEPQSPPFVLMGTMEFFMLDHSWIGEDHAIWAEGLYDSGPADYYLMPNLVDGRYIFNCTDPESCSCLYYADGSRDDPGDAIAESWGTVKSLY